MGYDEYYQTAKESPKGIVRYYREREARSYDIPADYYTVLKTLLSNEMREQFVSTKDCREHIMKLDGRYSRLLMAIDNLDQRLKRQEEIEIPRTIEIREVTIEKAKEMIVNYLKEHPSTYPDDIADELAIDLKTTMQVVEELIKEGKIEEM